MARDLVGGGGGGGAVVTGPVVVRGFLVLVEVVPGASVVVVSSFLRFGAFGGRGSAACVGEVLVCGRGCDTVNGAGGCDSARDTVGRVGA